MTTDPQPEMTLGDAITSLRQVANMYRAAKRLDDALVMVERAGTEAAALAATKSRAAAEIAKLQSEIAAYAVKRDANEKAMAGRASLRSAAYDTGRTIKMPAWRI